MTQLRSITHGMVGRYDPVNPPKPTPKSEDAYRKEWQSLPEVKKRQTHSNTWAKGKKGEYKPERQKLMADIYRDLQKNGPQLSRTIAERMGLATNTVSQLLQEIRKRHGTVEGKKDKTLGAFVWRAKKEAGK